MARKGCLIDKIKRNIATYRRIEPTDLTFSVDVYPGISATDIADEDEVDFLNNQYVEAGWIHAISSENLHVFYSKKEDNLVEI